MLNELIKKFMMTEFAKKAGIGNLYTCAEHPTFVFFEHNNTITEADMDALADEMPEQYELCYFTRIEDVELISDEDTDDESLIGQPKITLININI